MLITLSSLSLSYNTLVCFSLISRGFTISSVYSFSVHPFTSCWLFSSSVCSASNSFSARLYSCGKTYDENAYTLLIWTRDKSKKFVANLLHLFDKTDCHNNNNMKIFMLHYLSIVTHLNKNNLEVGKTDVVKTDFVKKLEFINFQIFPESDFLVFLFIECPKCSVWFP